MADTIRVTQMQSALEDLCEVIEKEKDYLSDLDAAIGDGDHGVNMAKCFREVRKKLSEKSADDFGTLFKSVGILVLNSVGGAMGALYGTFFLKLSEEDTGKTELKLRDLVRMFQRAEKGVLDIGKAQAGDKTLIDTLSPAVRALEHAEQEGKSLEEALPNMGLAARQGMESTKQMLAKKGRASRLGERTIGHQDAGATSCYFILESFARLFESK